VEGYIAKGIQTGATLAAGGGRPEDLDRGWYVEPTVFGNVDNTSVIAQEEIFGPVLSVIPADVERAREVAGKMRTGAIGREGGIDGLLPFLESKAILLDGPTAQYQGTEL